MKARQHFYVEGHTRGIPLNEDEEPTTADEPADTQVEEPSLFQKFEKFCSGFITDKHRERYERFNEAERKYLGENIEDVGAPADVWEEQEDAFNRYYKSRRLLCLVWEERGFWTALVMMYARVMYRWTLFRDTVFDRFLPKSTIFSYSRTLWYFIYYGLYVFFFFFILSWKLMLALAFFPLAFLLAIMCFAPRHEVFEKKFRARYLERVYETRAQDEEALSEEGV